MTGVFARLSQGSVFPSKKQSLGSTLIAQAAQKVVKKDASLLNLKQKASNKPLGTLSKNHSNYASTITIGGDRP